MNFKKYSFILSLFLIVSIQYLLFINNNQKSKFRFFIWNIQEISIGKLICISFISGLITSSILDKTLRNNMKNSYENLDKDNNEENYNSISSEENNEPFEMPPQRDVRETQPTISVNYRVIKNNEENFSKDNKETSINYQYEDDWNDIDSEW